MAVVTAMFTSTIDTRLALTYGQWTLGLGLVLCIYNAEVMVKVSFKMTRTTRVIAFVMAFPVSTVFKLGRKY